MSASVDGAGAGPEAAPAAAANGRTGATALAAYLRFGAQVLGLALPLAMMIVVDKVVNQGAVNTLVVLVLGVALLTAFQYLFLWAHTWHATVAAELQAQPRRTSLLRGLLASSTAPALANQGWDVAQGCLEDGRFGAEIGPQALADAGFVVLLVLCMAAFSPALALVSVAFTPLYVLVEAWGGRRAMACAGEAAGLRSAVSGRYFETVAAAPLLHDLGAAGRLAARWSTADGRLAAARCRVALARRGSALAVELLQRLSVIVVMLLGVSAVIAGAMTLGQYIAFNLLSLQLAQPVLRLAAFRRELQDQRLRGQVRGELEDRCRASPWPAGGVEPAERPAVSLQVRGLVTETAAGGREPVSFSLLGGGWLGIVGPSGSGKTTLLQTLAGARLPADGQVVVNGVPVHRLAPAARARLLRLLPQEPVIFSASLVENIALGVPQAPPEQIVAVARLCGLLELAAAWPDHLDTMIGVGGRALSGGERQRVALARALLSRPEVLLLDEATSALDQRAETQLLTAIRRWLPGAAVIVVSHRASSLAGCRQVLRLGGSGPLAAPAPGVRAVAN